MDGNSEIKIWSCESWTCLQTFKYAPNNGNAAKLKVAVDITANYILLSDMQRKVNINDFFFSFSDHSSHNSCVLAFAYSSIEKKRRGNGSTNSRDIGIFITVPCFKFWYR